jgi:hypothetical protein
MFGTRLRILGILIFAFCLPSLELPAQESVPLPVKKVELYKNGMGFFEHQGSVKGTKNVEIILPSSQLNDVLKSLTILDLGKGQIAGVTYDSAAPIEKRLAELPIQLTPESGLAGFLNQVRGTGIEIRTPAGVIAGKLMGAEIKTKQSTQGVTEQQAFISVFTADGQINLVALESAGSFKLTDPVLASDLSRQLGVLDSAHQRDVRKLKIQAQGIEERQIYIGYTSEVPIWKTTYRVVLDPKQKPLLQGWAIVDNTTPMDWVNVSLSLVSGAPISFIQNLSQPLYAQRPVIPLTAGVQVKPQASEATMMKEEADANKGALEDLEAAQERFETQSLGRSRSMKAMAMPSEIPSPASPAPSLSESVRKQTTAAAKAQSVGEQFEYKLRKPVTILRNESALLPILQSDVAGEKVAMFKSSDNEPHPRLAFWLKNSSGQTLDAGAVTVIDSDAFAGEGLIESVQPGESRLLSYAVDLGTEVSTNSGTEQQRVERVIISQGTMRLISKIAEKTTYRIRNNNETGRTMILEHPVRSEWKLKGSTPAETSANYYRFRVEAKPKATMEFVVSEESPQEETFFVSSITPGQIGAWVSARSIDPETEKSLRAIADKQEELNNLVQKIAMLDKEQNDIFKDQERVRGNLQRLGQTPDEATLRLRYIRQLDSQENRLAALKADRDKVQESRAAAQKQLEGLIQKLSLDKKL